MKTVSRILILSLVMFSTLSMAAVDSKKIKSVSAQLAKLLPNSGSYKLKKASPLEMMKELAYGPLEMSDFEYDAEASLGGDSSAWGIIKMAQAVKWVEGSEYLNQDENGEEFKNSPKSQKAAALVKSLVGTGVVFGAGPFGAVQCGFTYPALLFIDTEAGVIYTFETEGSGC